MILVVRTSKLLTFVDTFTKSAKAPEFSAVVDLGRKEAVLMLKSTTAENSGVFADLVKVSTKVKSFDVRTTNIIKCSQKKFGVHATFINAPTKISSRGVRNHHDF